MRRVWSIVLLLCVVCVFAASCGDDAPRRSERTVARDAGVDVDLTALSSVMVYAEVYNMLTSPLDYIGKVVKADGAYSAMYIEETNSFYHFVVIDDAAACCQQGLEFIWTGDHVYPDDYPKQAAKIGLTGVFSSYEEYGEIYYCLETDSITVLG